MRVIIALAVLAVFLSLGGCSRNKQAVYAKPVPSAPLPHPTKASSVKPAPLPARKFPKARSPMPPSGTRSASAGAVDSEVKFKAAQMKAEKLGVHQLTQEDIDGLSLAQIKQLRGY
jgi:hypothetical protein